MTTPTPGDLSARHVEVLRRFLRMNNALLYSGEREALDAAIAALSAPNLMESREVHKDRGDARSEAGGPIATVCLRGDRYAHGHMQEFQLQLASPDTDLPIGTKLYTTPQPSALPAAGGLAPVLTAYRCDYCGHDYYDTANCCESRREYLAAFTTPQPSAAYSVAAAYRDQRVAEKVGALADMIRKKPSAAEWAERASAHGPWIHGHRTRDDFPPPDAALLPLGNESLADTQRAIIEAAERRGYELAQAEAAAPAAGKGVDDAMVDRALNARLGLNTKTADMIAHPDQHDSVIGPRWKRAFMRAALEAALTRQPAPSDDDLPGMWSHSDFTGGDPDERSHHERTRQSVAGDGWRVALQKVADSWGVDFGDAEAFFFDAIHEWRPDDTHLLIPRDELIERDDYGVFGSDFFTCKLCGASSGAGLLNKGIPHHETCRLAAPAATPTDGGEG